VDFMAKDRELAPQLTKLAPQLTDVSPNFTDVLAQLTEAVIHPIAHATHLDEHREQGGRQKDDQRPELRGDHGEGLCHRIDLTGVVIHSPPVVSADDVPRQFVGAGHQGFERSTTDQSAPERR
jgi:hypothetical protein